MQGIEGLLSKGRCPQTDEDEALLKSCLTELRKLESNNADWRGSFEKAATLLLLLFEVYDKFKEIL